MVCPKCTQKFNYLLSGVTFQTDTNRNKIILCPHCQAELIVKENNNVHASRAVYFALAIIPVFTLIINVFYLQNNRIATMLFYCLIIPSALYGVYLFYKYVGNSASVQVNNLPANNTSTIKADGFDVNLNREKINNTRTTGTSKLIKKMAFFLAIFFIGWFYLIVKSGQSVGLVLPLIIGLILIFFTWGITSYLLRNKNGGLIIGLIVALIIGVSFIFYTVKIENEKMLQEVEKQSQLRFNADLEKFKNSKQFNF
ncbi:MAG: hypothetical protein WCK11_03565 [Candidatus Falkowbacteria bacterium]